MKSRDIILVVCGGTLGSVAMYAHADVGVGQIVSSPDFRQIEIPRRPQVDEFLMRELVYEPTRDRPKRDWEQRSKKRRRK